MRAALRVILAIMQKEMRVTFGNRSLVLFTLLGPVVLALLFGAATGSLNNPGAALETITIAVVNLDEGNGIASFGGVFTAVLVADAAGTSLPGDSAACDTMPAADSEMTLPDLHGVPVSDADAARQGVERGDYAAAIIIPPDFSQKIGYTPLHRTVEPAAVEVYASSGNVPAAALVHTLAEIITRQIATGSIAFAATLETLAEKSGTAAAAAAALNEDLIARLSCAFLPAFGAVTLEQAFSGEQTQTDFFTFIASGQAVFFMLIVALRGATDMLNERKQGTLQRLLVAPFPAGLILTGKLCGTILVCMIQLVLLGIAFSVINSILKGSFQPIWKASPFEIALVMLAASVAAAGLGVLVMAFARTHEQAAAFSGIVSTVLGIVGGAFLPVDGVPVLSFIARLSPVYWSSNAFYRLGSGQGDIMLNLVVLMLMGGVMAGAGIWLFYRRQEV